MNKGMRDLQFVAVNQDLFVLVQSQLYYLGRQILYTISIRYLDSRDIVSACLLHLGLVAGICKAKIEALEDHRKR